MSHCMLTYPLAHRDSQSFAQRQSWKGRWRHPIWFMKRPATLKFHWGPRLQANELPWWDLQGAPCLAVCRALALSALGAACRLDRLVASFRPAQMNVPRAHGGPPHAAMGGRTTHSRRAYGLNGQLSLSHAR
jgi:hypothetical protein